MKEKVGHSLVAMVVVKRRSLIHYAKRGFYYRVSLLLSEDEDDTGLTVAQVIQMQVKDNDRCLLLAKQFGIDALLSRRFKYLSTGESRKVLLIQLLMNKPDLLILDEPFDGLDIDSRRTLSELLSSLHQQKLTIVLILNRGTM